MLKNSTSRKKLTLDQILDIRIKHCEGEVNGKKLTQEYCVDEYIIKLILNRKSWRNNS